MSLLPASRTTRWAGLGHQTGRETSLWWRHGRWWRQAIVWGAALGTLLVAMLWILPTLLAREEGQDLPATDVAETAAQFTELAAVITAAGVTILSQGLLIDDRRSGTMEWILSKPLSRPALVLSKFTGQMAGLAVSAIAIPWVLVWVLISTAHGSPWPAGRLVGTVVVITVLAGFQVSLVLALSSAWWSRGLALAVPLALVFGSDLAITLVPDLARFNPYLLGRVGAGLLSTGDLMTAWPLMSAVFLTLVLIGVAVWRVDRLEL